MFIVEPFLNKFYRNQMKSALKFDNVSNESVSREEYNNNETYLLYVHIPFCESLCPYCSFHKYVIDKNIAREYFKALRKELHLYKNAGYDFKGLYIGGGTPTIMMDELLKTMNLIHELFNVKSISIETNPNHLTDENIKLLQDAKVDRLSVGVQSFDDALLKKIGRYQKYGSGKEIKERLRNAMGKFNTLNVDLIFNMPTQTKASLERDLDIIDSLLTEQVTFYPLMSSANVEKSIKDTLGSVNYKQEKDFYFTILNRMKQNYTGSTAWCFSREASMVDEYVIEYDNYVGAGSGAFGYYNGRIYVNTFSLKEYIDKINSNELPIALIKQFTEKENMYYFMLMKLFGLSMSEKEFEKRFNTDINKALYKEMLLLNLSKSVKKDKGIITLTDRGRYYWVMGMREFFIAVDNLRDHCRKRIEKIEEEKQTLSE